MPDAGPNTNPFGQAGEELAATWLERQGCTILHRNWTCSLGEIDLIARDETTLMFVEVKARRNLEHGHPLESVTPSKQKKLLRCAQAYLQSRGDQGLHPRCDAVGILLNQDPPEITWVKNAFGE